MIGFEYYNPAKIVFGEESEKSIKDLLASYQVKSLLLVYSGDFIKDLGIYSVIKEAVDELGINFSENGSVVPNPTIELARELVEEGKKENVDFVLGSLHCTDEMTIGEFDYYERYDKKKTQTDYLECLIKNYSV